MAIEPCNRSFPECPRMCPARGRESVVRPRTVAVSLPSTMTHRINSKVNKSKERMVYFPSRCPDAIYPGVRIGSTYFRLLSAMVPHATDSISPLHLCCCTGGPASSCTCIDSPMNMLPPVLQSPLFYQSIALTTLILDERNSIPPGLLSQPRCLARRPPPPLPLPLRRYLCHHHDDSSTTPISRSSLPCFLDSLNQQSPTTSRPQSVPLLGRKSFASGQALIP